MKRLLSEEQARDMVEYSLLLVLLGAVVLIYLTGMGFNLAKLFGEIGTKLESISKTPS